MLKNIHLSFKISEFFFFLSFLIVTIFNNLGNLLIILLFLFTFLLKNKFYFLNEDFYIIFLFYFLFLFSFTFVSFFSIFIIGISYVDFYYKTFGRMGNVIIYFTFFLFIIDTKNKRNIPVSNITKAYITGCYVLLFFAVWQILNMFFNIPYPNFNTRNYFHSIDISKIPSFLKIRITSIASEPAFLIPYLIDAIIILFYSFKKYVILILFFIVIFFTLSLSGYINLFLIITLIFIFSKKTFIKLFFNILFIIIFLISIYLLQDIFLLVFERLNLSKLMSSGRIQESVLPLKYMFTEASLFNFIFGFGPKGMAYISNFIFNTSGTQHNLINRFTSHVIFVDFFIEYGIIGLLDIILLFIYLFNLATKTYKNTKNRLSQVLCINLFITSLYTSDYASPRFTIIIILLLFLYKDSKKKHETTINKQINYL